jgi:acetyl esterase/lipase
MRVSSRTRAPKMAQHETVGLVSDDGVELLADLYRAAQGSTRRAAIVVVHGGAWRHGDKGENPASNRWLAANGFLVLDIRYRLAPVADWRVPVADVGRAVMWLGANADALGIEPTRVALLGRSAGAHLALLAAYMAREHGPPVTAGGKDTAGDALPAGVVAFYSPTDLALLRQARHEDVRLGLRALVGNDPEGYHLAAPLSHVRPGLPPTLLIHGTWDSVVLPAHSRRLARALREQQVRVELLEVPFARHAFDLVEHSLQTLLAHQAVAAFLDEHLQAPDLVTPSSDETQRSIRAARAGRRSPRASL